MTEHNSPLQKVEDDLADRLDVVGWLKTHAEVARREAHDYVKRVRNAVLDEVEQELPDDWTYYGADDELYHESHGYNDALRRVREIIKEQRHE